MIWITKRFITCTFLCGLIFARQSPAMGLGADPASGSASVAAQEEATAAKGEKSFPVQVDLKRAQKAAEHGDRAAEAGRLEEALLYYQEAVHFAPKDEGYVKKETAVRSQIVRMHVAAAEKAAVEGRMEFATDELAKALRIDPGDAMVAERLTQMNSMKDEPPTKEQLEITGLPKLQPKSGKQDLDLRGETRSVYEELALRFGIKASFDPDVTGRPVRLRVQDVDFYTAMTLLGAQTGTFWRALSPTLIFVTPDSPEKRKEYAPEAEAAFPLPAAVAPDEMTELLRVLRDITGATHIELDTRSRTITMRDTPEKLEVAEKLIQEVEKARGEVLLDIELLEVDRGAMRNLGITPPSSVSLILLTPNDVKSLAASTDLANLLTNAQSIFSGQGFSSIPAFALVGGGLSTFLLTMPTATANFADSLSLVQSGQEVLLRAQEGKPATFFVGDRYPVTLSLLSNSLGTGGSLTPTTGAVTFPETSFAVGSNPTALVSAPFTGGTLHDLAVVFNSAGTNTFTILQNQDNGNFVQVTPAPITLGSNETGQVAIGTGVLRTDSTKYTTAQPYDVLLVNSTSNNVSVLLGNVDATTGLPNGTFTEAPGSPIAVGKNPSSIIVADFNGDGILDFAVTNEADNSISVFRGTGDGTFTQFPAAPFLLNKGGVAETGPVAMVSGTFRQGDTTDLAVVNQTSGNVSILLDTIDQNQNITLTEAPGSPIAVGNSPVAIATGDLNADGVGDLAIVNQGDNTLSILLGSTSINGTFTAAPTLATAATPASVAIGNFANGASPDIVVTNKGASTLSVFIGLGGGLFQTGVELNVPASPGNLIVDVLTSSGLPDVAFVAQGPTAGQGIVSIVQDSAALAANGSGTGETPYPGAEFMDIGLKIKATPSLHPNNQVTLALEFEIRSLAGTNVNGIPVISNRTLTQTIRVKDDQPTLIGGLADREETRAITGLPGLAGLPGIGYLFGSRASNLTDTELMILITPHRLRAPPRQTGTIFAGHGERGSTPSTLPSERVQPP